MATDAARLPAGSAVPSAESGLLGRLQKFLVWWRAELLAALPVQWRDRLAGRAAGVPILLRPLELVQFRFDEGRLVESARISLEGLDADARVAAIRRSLASRPDAGDALIFLLPPESFVRRTIELPAAAEEALQSVVGFELDRHTPFRASDAVFQARVVGRSRDQANIRVDLVAAPRAVVESCRKQANELGLPLAAILPCIEESGLRDLDLLPDAGPDSRGMSSATRLNLALGFLLLVLMAVALAVPVFQKRDAAIRLLPRLNDARQESDQVQKTRAELERLVGDANFILGKKYAQPSATQLMEDLAKAFPDTTWVAILELKSGKTRELVLTGETASATRVVEMLEQIPYLKNPSFRSPLNKAPGQTAERFVIAAEVKPRPLPATTDASVQPAGSSAPAAPALPAAQPAPAQVEKKQTGNPSAPIQPSAPPAQTPSQAPAATPQKAKS